MKWPPVALLLALGYPLVAAAADAGKTGNELATAQASYQAQVQKIEGESLAQLQKLPADYVKDLETLGQALQKKGELDGLLAVRKEKDRAAAARALEVEPADMVPESSLVETPAELRRLQEKYMGLPVSVKAEQKKRILSLSRRYLQHLEQMQKALTKDGRIDEALQVKTEVEKIRALPDIVAEETAKPPDVMTANPRLDTPTPTASATTEDRVLFKDNFTQLITTRWRNEHKAWRTVGGKYGVEKGTPQTGIDGNPVTTVGDYSWTDYEVECDLLSANDAGILLRVQDERNCYALVIRPNGRDMFWKIWKNGDINSSPDIGRASLPPGVKADDDLRLRVVVRGSRLQAFVNDEYVTEMEDSTFRRGCIGLYIHVPADTKQYFDNLVVRKLPEGAIDDATMDPPQEPDSRPAAEPARPLVQNAKSPLVKSDLTGRLTGTRWSWNNNGWIEFQPDSHLVTPWGTGTWKVVGGRCDAKWGNLLHRLTFSDDFKSFVSKRALDGEVSRGTLQGR